MDNDRDRIDWAHVGRWVEENELPHLVRLLQEVALSARMPEDEPIDRLESLGGLREVLEQIIRIEVQEMRRQYQSSWVEIADALHMTRQGARQKYQHPADETLAEYEQLRDIEMATLKADIDVAVANLRLEGVKRGWTSQELEAEMKALHNSFKPRAARFIEDHMDRFDKVLTQTERTYKKGTKDATGTRSK